MKPDTEPDPYTIPKLRLFSTAPHLSEPSGALTPPLQTAASVPFRWEEHPGKPLPSTDLTVVSTTPPNIHLNLPPRLATVEPNIIITNSPSLSPSPTTVLDGPGDVRTKSLFSSSSFRFATERRRRWRGSFDSDGGGGWSPDGDNGGGRQLLLLGGKIDRRNGGGGGLFGSFRSFRLTGARNPKGSFVNSRSSSWSSSVSTGFFEEMNGRKTRRKSRVSKVIKLKLWAKIYEGFKQVVPWRKKPKIESFNL